MLLILAFVSSSFLAFPLFQRTGFDACTCRHLNRHLNRMSIFGSASLIASVSASCCLLRLTHCLIALASRGSLPCTSLIGFTDRQVRLDRRSKNNMPAFGTFGSASACIVCGELAEFFPCSDEFAYSTRLSDPRPEPWSKLRVRGEDVEKDFQSV